MYLYSTQFVVSIVQVKKALNTFISGLDPARPLFEVPIMAPEYRLDKSDAEFVDIIHTCGGVYGYEQSYGHADFYPNNGYPMQPGCSGARQVLGRNLVLVNKHGYRSLIDMACVYE